MSVEDKTKIHSLCSMDKERQREENRCYSSMIEAMVKMGQPQKPDCSPIIPAYIAIRKKNNG